MDVSLIQPRNPLLDIGVEPTLAPPISILYLATVLEHQGLSVNCYDLNVYAHKKAAYEHFRSEFEKHTPPIVGISTTTPTFPNALLLAKIVKEICKDTLVVLGGHHVTFLPNEALHDPNVDVIVRGEGELTFLELVSNFINAKDLRTILGTSYKKDNKIYSNPDSPPLHNLDELPYPNRNLVQLERYKASSHVISSRGCFAHCIFCCVRAFARKLRVRSPENVVNEIYHLNKNYNFNKISLVDYSLTFDANRTLKMCDLIKELGLNISWVCETRINGVKEELLKKMAEAGCVAIQFGVESGDPAILRKIKKGISIKQIENVVEAAVRVGIRPMCNFMIGHADDTSQTIQTTIKFAKKLQKIGSEISLGVSTPFPGTELYHRREELGVKIVDWDYSKWDTYHAVVETKHLTQKEIEKYFFQIISAIHSVK